MAAIQKKYTWKKDEDGSRIFYEIKDEEIPQNKAIIEASYNDVTNSHDRVRNVDDTTTHKEGITGDFKNQTGNDGGAIYNRGNESEAEIGDVTGNFVENHATSVEDDTDGGAIYNNEAKMGNIKGDFVGNYAKSEIDSANGGAILNQSGKENTKAEIGDITGNFIGNYAETHEGYFSSSGGAIS